MIKFDTIVYDILEGDATIRQLIGTYTKGSDQIYKIFAGFAPLNEEAGADFPFIHYNTAYKTLGMLARVSKQYEVTIRLFSVAQSRTEAMDISDAVADLLNHYKNDSINPSYAIQDIGRLQKAFDEYDDDLDVWFVPMQFTMKINIPLT